MPRPSFSPTRVDRELVRSLSAWGIPEDGIARQIPNPRGKTGTGISVKTLRKYFREELATGLQSANAKVAQALYKKALSGDTAAMIFWLKTRAGWQQGVEISGPEGGPIPVQGVIVLPAIVEE